MTLRTERRENSFSKMCQKCENCQFIISLKRRSKVVQSALMTAFYEGVRRHYRKAAAAARVMLACDDWFSADFSLIFWHFTELTAWLQPANTYTRSWHSRLGFSEAFESFQSFAKELFDQQQQQWMPINSSLVVVVTAATADANELKIRSFVVFLNSSQHSLVQRNSTSNVDK